MVQILLLVFLVRVSISAETNQDRIRENFSQFFNAITRNNTRIIAKQKDILRSEMIKQKEEFVAFEKNNRIQLLSRKGNRIGLLVKRENNIDEYINYLLEDLTDDEEIKYKNEIKQIIKWSKVNDPKEQTEFVLNLYAKEKAEHERTKTLKAELNIIKEKDQHLKFCNVAREEIVNLDEYAYSAKDNAGKEFAYDLKLVREKLTYFDQQITEKRRQRIVFALKYSNNNNILELKERLGPISIEVFADKISRAYGMLSKAVYTPGFHGTICYNIMQSKAYNKYLNILLEDFDWDVGKVVYVTTKRTTETDN